MRGLPVALAAALVLGGCSPQPQQRQPVGSDDGIQLTGRIADKRLAVSEGQPQVLLGDCDPNDGRDRDLCAVTSTIDGERLAIVVENPDALAVGTIDVAGERCSVAECDAVRDVAVVDVRLGTTTIRAVDGRLELREVGQRYYRGAFQLELVPNGRVTGTFSLDTFGDGS